jgi:thiamine-monophosphate kinase
VNEALLLHQQANVHAMIDISDGLAADVNHICEESGCGAVLRGAVLRAEAIPVSDAARRMGDGRSPLEHALGDGEDFELVFAVSAEDGKKLIESQPVTGITLAHIGECVAEDGLFLDEQTKRRTLQPLGYVHRFH